MRAAVVSSDEVTSAGSTIRQQRSQSEIRRPAFYLPGELPKKNSYTCLWKEKKSNPLLLDNNNSDKYFNLFFDKKLTIISTFYE